MPDYATSTPVGDPHRGDADGCFEDCPSPDHFHATHAVVAITPALAPLLAEWLDALGVTLEYVPTPPSMAEHHYAAVIRAGSDAAALLEPSIMDGRIRPPRRPDPKNRGRG